MSRNIRSSIAALVGLFGSVGTLAGQDVRPGPASSWDVVIEALRPSLGPHALRQNEAIVSGVVFATGRYALSPAARVVVDLPLARGSFAASASPLGTVPAASGTTLGSPYLGLELGRAGRGAAAELGVRLPLVATPRTADDSSSLAVGRYADLDRADAFAPRVGTITAVLGYAFTGPAGLRLRLHAGPVGQFVTGGAGAAPMALWLSYRAEAELPVRGLDLLAGLGGRAMMTPMVAGPTGATGHQALIGVRIRCFGLHPGATLRIPLGGELRSDVRAVLGFDLGVPLG